MTTKEPIESLIASIHGLDRDGCIAKLRQMHQLKMDFSDEYLADLSVDRLRHVLLAACVQVRKSKR